jgi:peroxiredoxin
MKFARLELLFVIGVVAVVVSYFQQAPSSAPGPEAPLAAFTPGLLSIGQPVPTFALSDPSGENVVYQAGQGPVMIVLTATGCGGCLERIDGLDREAYNKAKERGIPVWNLLVYQGVEGARAFQEQHQPSADLVLCDQKAEVSVATLGGSDATCWLLIDKQGKLAWRGPANSEGLSRALQAL